MKKSVTIVAASLAGLLGFGTAFGANVIYNGSKRLIDATAVTLTSDGAKYEDGSDSVTVVNSLNDDADGQYETALGLIDDFDPAGISQDLQDKICDALDVDTAVYHESVPLVIKGYTGGELDFVIETATDYNYLDVHVVQILIYAPDENGNLVPFLVEGIVDDMGKIQFHVNKECAAALARGAGFACIYSRV
jgi:hypothetical protein